MSPPVAIVTGAGRGIGAATVAALAAEELGAVVAAANEAAATEVARAEIADTTIFLSRWRRS